MERLSQEKIVEIFKSTPEEHPLFIAMIQVIEDHILDNVDAAIAPELCNEARQFNAGRACSLKDLLAALKNIKES